MMPLKKRRRVQVILLAAVALTGSTAMIGWAMRDGIAYYRSPTEVAEAPPGPTELFRIGGLVEAGSVVRGEGETVSFRVTDCAVSIPVTFTGVLPDLFEENESTVSLGRYEGGTFEATEVLAKHDESYMPKEVADSLEAQGMDPAAGDHTYGCQGVLPESASAQQG